MSIETSSEKVLRYETSRRDLWTVGLDKTNDGKARCYLVQPKREKDGRTEGKKGENERTLM